MKLSLYQPQQKQTQLIFKDDDVALSKLNHYIFHEEYLSKGYAAHCFFFLSKRVEWIVFQLKDPKQQLHTLNPCQADALLMTGVFRDTYLNMSNHTFFQIKNIRMNSLLFQPSLLQDSVFHHVYSMSSIWKIAFHFGYHSKHRSSQSYALEKTLWRRKCHQKTRKPSFPAFRPMCDQPLRKPMDPLSTTQRKMLR